MLNLNCAYMQDSDIYLSFSGNEMLIYNTETKITIPMLTANYSTNQIQRYDEDHLVLVGNPGFVEILNVNT